MTNRTTWTDELVAETKAEVLRLLDEGLNLKQIKQTLDLAAIVLYRWRQKDPEFDEAIREYTGTTVGPGGTTWDPDRELPPKGNFMDWRMTYLGRPTPEHMLPAVEAMEDFTNNVVFVLMPTGAGKDTTALDWVLYRKCDDRELKVCVIMKSEEHAKRRIARLSEYLTDPTAYRVKPDGPGTKIPAHNLIEDYGPFEWDKDLVFPDGTKVPQTSFTKHKLEFIKGAQAPESDPDIWATGLNAALYGARIGLMVLSDIFDDRNQANPVLRAQQLEWLDGIAKTRLDSRGQRIFLGTRIHSDDNYGKIINDAIQNAQVIYTDESGYYRKFSNGVAVVVVPAIQINEEGEERSYWEDKFPLDTHVELPSGERLAIDGLDDEQRIALGRAGAVRVEGLVDEREANPTVFASVKQQAPPATSASDFHRVLLDHCLDPTATYQVASPGSRLVLGVDPARVGGAAWFLWAWNEKQETATAVDWFYGERLGINGIINTLIVDPIHKYIPQILVYEVNKYELILHQPAVQEAVRAAGIRVVPHQTGHANRGRYALDDEVSVPTMAIHMQRDHIKFPAAAGKDMSRNERLFDQFVHWSPVSGRSGQARSTHPDDLVMAAWFGWKFIAENWLDRRKKNGMVREAIPDVVWRRWGSPPARTEKESRRPETDLIGLYHSLTSEGSE